MSTPKITIYDASTGEIVTRDMNASEIAELENEAAQAIKEDQTKAKAKEAAQIRKQTILDRLGITGDEFNALLS